MRRGGRQLSRRAFYRSRVLREVIAATRRLTVRRDDPDLAHLTFYDEVMDGPLQRDEALFLHALLRVVRPHTVLEIGFLRGHSAFNFLRALDGDARLYSFDIDPECEGQARELFGEDARFVLTIRSQAEITPEDLDGRLADFVFLDASHDLELNQATFERLLRLMPRAQSWRFTTPEPYHGPCSRRSTIGLCTFLSSGSATSAKSSPTSERSSTGYPTSIRSSRRSIFIPSAPSAAD